MKIVWSPLAVERAYEAAAYICSGTPAGVRCVGDGYPVAARLTALATGYITSRLRRGPLTDRIEERLSVASWLPLPTTDH